MGNAAENTMTLSPSINSRNIMKHLLGARPCAKFWGKAVVSALMDVTVKAGDRHQETVPTKQAELTVGKDWVHCSNILILSLNSESRTNA